MTERIQAIRGMNDILPSESPKWQALERQLADCMRSYGYQEIRFPILESTSLFKRTIGDITDIVEKEMYTFLDLNQESLSMRPEGTAGCIRACLEHGLLHNQQQKLWYSGPMFRYEKPQKGRYRQFHQFGVEALGFSGAGIELELILLCQRLWTDLGIEKGVKLQINTLGVLEERQAYRQILIDYFSQYMDILDEDCKRRLQRSPMRILDSKNPALADVIRRAPSLMDCLGDNSRQHFSDLTAGLDALGIQYQINPKLVRGLDYYGHTVFEWVSDHLGAQATVCAGGRYDTLVEQLGGTPTPAIGFGLGIERLLLLMESMQNTVTHDANPDIFMITEDAQYLTTTLFIAEQLRRENGYKVMVYLGSARMKSQFKQADKSGARVALILGAEEIQEQAISIKDLRQFGQQEKVKQKVLPEALKRSFENKAEVGGRECHPYI
ncbi:MAG TPA: histidine--tRNA ligase [Legionellaceae bacterium]|nr:histidine--tRNA ligase [Legionellaceae bacterium]